jgi:hypothetical protein
MGTSGWDDEPSGRDWSRRGGRAGNGERPDGRAYDGIARGGTPRGPDRSERGMRGRDDPGARSGGGRERARSPRPRDGDFEEDPRRLSTNRGRPGPAEYERGGRGRGRDEWRDPRESFDGWPERSQRGPRPARGDDWPPPRGRGGAPGASGTRARPPGRAGGLWDDEPMPRRRPDASDARGRSGAGRYDPRDPRAFRRGLVETSQARAVAEKEGGLTAGKSLLIIVFMLLLGIAAAYGYYRFSTPHISPPATPASGMRSSPAASPLAAQPPRPALPGSGLVTLA